MRKKTEADASGFVEIFTDATTGEDICVPRPAKGDPRKPTSNEQTFEPQESLVPVLVSAVTDILTVGAIAPHRSAIRRHLSDRALDAAIAKLQSIRR